MTWTVEIHFKDSSAVKTVHEADVKATAADVLSSIITTGMIYHPEGKAIYINHTEVKTLSVAKGSGDFIATRKRPFKEARSFPVQA